MKLTNAKCYFNGELIGTADVEIPNMMKHNPNTQFCECIECELTRHMTTHSDNICREILGLPKKPVPTLEEIRKLRRRARNLCIDIEAESQVIEDKPLTEL